MPDPVRIILPCIGGPYGGRTIEVLDTADTSFDVPVPPTTAASPETARYIRETFHLPDPGGGRVRKVTFLCAEGLARSEIERLLAQRRG